MALRKLEPKDRYGMLEWMQDKDIMACFRMEKDTIDEEKVKNFIEDSFNEKCRHYAIVDEHDEYLGTISLKNIDSANSNAEYAVVLRKQAIGGGVARTATNELLDIAFNELKLQKVYLNVLSNNKRAINFYRKINFKLEGEFKDHVYIGGKYVDLSWYAINKEDYLNARL